MRAFHAALAAAVLALPANLLAAQFAGMYVFGDSLSDTGNAQTKTQTYNAIFGSLVPVTPGPYYADGRFSNGPNYVDRLAGRLGIAPVMPSVVGGTNFAHGGAKTTGTAFPQSLAVDDLDDQVTSFLAAPPAASADRLYVVFAGSNDLLAGNDPTAAANRLVGQIGRLYDAGAHQILAPTLPLQGLTPRFNGDATSAAAANAVSMQFNSALNAGLDTFAAAHPDATLYRPDVAGIFADIVANPSAYGLANATASAAPGLTPGASAYDTSRIVANPNQYLFWDDLHPTTAGHALLADAFYAAVVPEPATLVLVLAFAPAVVSRRRRVS